MQPDPLSPERIALNKAFFLVEEAFSKRGVRTSIHFRSFHAPTTELNTESGTLLIFSCELQFRHRPVVFENFIGTPVKKFQTPEHWAWMLAQRVRGVAAGTYNEQESPKAALEFLQATSGIVEELLEKAALHKGQ